MRILKKKNFSNTTETGIKSVLGFVEIIIATLAVIFVILGAVYLVFELPTFWHDLAEHALHGPLEEILLVVVGVELIIMLILRTPESLLDVMLFVIARKMLIKSSEFYELMIGVAALAGLFAIRKYLGYIANRQHDEEEEE